MTPNQKLHESRRRELQATCLGAAYLGANAAFIPMRGPLLANWKFLIANTGDDYARPRVHDHGNRGEPQPVVARRVQQQAAQLLQHLHGRRRRVT